MLLRPAFPHNEDSGQSLQTWRLRRNSFSGLLKVFYEMTMYFQQRAASFCLQVVTSLMINMEPLGLRAVQEATVHLGAGPACSRPPGAL